ncbi:MAG: glutamine synthetase [Candidatus Heimdallarchaeota archaeon]|nr:glutamine synthetase [Candidatus Heimdallarchaeota archaeon]
MELKSVLEIIDRQKITEVALQFTSIPGTLHTLWIPVSELKKAVEEGIHTDGSSLGVVDVSKSDVKLMPDLRSFSPLPVKLFPQKVARIVCDIYKPDSNEPFILDPRFVLKKAIKDIQNVLGADVMGIASSEIEFFIFTPENADQVRLIDQGGYLASPPTDKAAELRLEITEELRKIGVIVEKHHHEVPHGKSEFNIPCSDVISMADTIYLIKFIIKLMSARKGLIASFMPKPFHGEYGAGLHTHINLVDENKGQNLFSSLDNSGILSEIGFNFMAGVLSHAKALAGITNPSVNSYKRLVPGWEAPVYISWAHYNRSTLIRIPPGNKKAARLEYRPTDGSCNFYIAYAALLAAGRDGIENTLTPPDPVEDNIYHMNIVERKARGIAVLPENLGEALKELSKDQFITEGLGSEFIQKYLQLKQKEWHEFSVHVHDWERKRYIDV